jgi:hypothetical protein
MRVSTLKQRGSTVAESKGKPKRDKRSEKEKEEERKKKEEKGVRRNAAGKLLGRINGTDDGGWEPNPNDR